MSHAVEQPSYLSGFFINSGQKYPVRIEVRHTRAGWQAICSTEPPRRGLVPPYSGSFDPHQEWGDLIGALRKRLADVREVIEL